MERKKCSKCKEEKLLTEFHADKSKKDRHSSTCKICAINRRQEHYRQNREKATLSMKKYYQANKTEIIKYNKKYRENNKEKTKINSKKRYDIKKKLLNKQRREKRHQNKEEFNRKRRERYHLIKKELNKKRNKYIQTRKAKDEPFKISLAIRACIYKSLKYSGYSKDKLTEQILGCSIKNFKDYLESKFENWMNWNNYGRYNPMIKTWQIDHVVPISSAKTQAEAISLNHYTNLRPLESIKNMAKGNKID